MSIWKRKNYTLLQTKNKVHYISEVRCNSATLILMHVTY